MAIVVPTSAVRTLVVPLAMLTVDVPSRVQFWLYHGTLVIH